jgi:ADP-ribosylglycohydrolase
MVIADEKKQASEAGDPAKAILFGLALGDALGWPVEFLDRPLIRARYGRLGIVAPPDPALYTDDTQMSAAVAEALVEAGEQDLDTLMAAVSHNFIAWKNNPITATRAPGATCIRGVNALELGAPWREAGVKDSKGCGACMRVAPIGYFYQHDLEKLMQTARAQGWLTHRHPASDAACLGAAQLVKLALDRVAPRDFPDRIRSATEGVSKEFDSILERLEHVRDWTDEEAALNYIGPTRGGGWIAEEAVGMALYCVLRRPNDYRAAITLAANISGDSDTVACLTGGVLGARLGISAIPADWIERLENRDYLSGLAGRLAEKRTQIFGTYAVHKSFYHE